MHSKASQVLKIIFCVLFFIGFINTAIFASRIESASAIPNEESTHEFIGTVSEITELQDYEDGQPVLSYEIGVEEYEEDIFLTFLEIADADALKELEVGDKIIFWVELKNIIEHEDYYEIKYMDVVQLYSISSGNYIVTFESYGKILEPILNLSKNISMAFAVILFILFVLFVILIMKGKKNLRQSRALEMQKKKEKLESYLKSISANKNSETEKLEKVSSSSMVGGSTTQTYYESIADESADDISELQVKYSLCKHDITVAASGFYLCRYLPAIILLTLLFAGGITLTIIACMSTSIPLALRGVGIVTTMFSFFFIVVCVVLAKRATSKYKADEEGKVTIGITFDENMIKFINFHTKQKDAWLYRSIKCGYELKEYFVLQCGSDILIISKESLGVGTILKIRQTLSQKISNFKQSKED